MRVTKVSYGRTIEVGGPFGSRAPIGKVWFGWEAEVESFETAATVLAALEALADKEEGAQRAAFEERTGRRRGR